ncbi:unnamed protein product [Polarella glacialis]|uniref:Phospholipase/carboxylesterase/thioesterase domain-containing protein n=1 Tax=Polarella glacialis TaxID=89957 RepID=A0A813DI00_POLGL|nr:unnamed protein product [Polarella glacialis]
MLDGLLAMGPYLDYRWSRGEQEAPSRYGQEDDPDEEYGYGKWGNRDLEFGKRRSGHSRTHTASAWHQGSGYEDWRWNRSDESPSRTRSPSWKRQRRYSEEGGGSGAKCEEEWWDLPATEEASGSGWQYPTFFHDVVLQPGGGCPGSSGSKSAASDGVQVPQPRLVLLFFHSCTHGPEDVFQFLPYIWSAGLKPQEVRVLAPCSPQRMQPSGRESHSWYDYTTDRCWRGSAPDRVEYSQLLEQRQRLLQILEDEHRNLAPGGRIVLGGLSQGAALAIDVMLHAPEHIASIAGCFCLRGMMQGETHVDLPQKLLIGARAAQSSSTMASPMSRYHGSWPGSHTSGSRRMGFRWTTASRRTFPMPPTACRSISEWVSSLQD